MSDIQPYRPAIPLSKPESRELARKIRERSRRSMQQRDVPPGTVVVRQETLRPMARPTRQFMLCDTSGSMSLAVGDRRRIDILTDALELVLEECPAARLIAFASRATVLDSLSELPRPHGGTNLSAAIELAAQQEASQLVILSDGCASSPDAALRSAKRLGVPIDVVFTGDPSDRGAQAFMRELAGLNRGEMHTQALERADAPRLAATTVRLLLASPRTRS